MKHVQILNILLCGVGWLIWSSVCSGDKTPEKVEIPVGQMGELSPTGEVGSTNSELSEAILSPPDMVDISKLPVLLGFDPRPYSKFWDKWKMVTVRFRSVPGEQRFEYANSLAWETLRKGKRNFPEGAVLGKVTFEVGFDPRFPSSYEPMQLRTVQLMKKDKKLFPETNGWGYYLFFKDNPQGDQFTKEKVMACHACHNLAKSHDFVFSTPLFLNSSKEPVYDISFIERFKLAHWHDLPTNLTKALEKYPEIKNRDFFDRELVSPSDLLFQNALPLARLAIKTETPLIIRNSKKDSAIFSFKKPDRDKDCPNGARVVHLELGPSNEFSTRYETDICNGIQKSKKP